VGDDWLTATIWSALFLSIGERLHSLACRIGFPRLAIQDIAADLPMQQNQFTIDRQRNSELHNPDAALQVGEELRVPSIATLRTRLESRQVRA